MASSIAQKVPTSKDIQRKMEFLDEDEATPPTQAERIAFRNWKIEARRLKRANLLDARKQKPPEPVVPLASKIQTRTSRVAIDAALLDAEQTVSDVGREREDTEDQRRRDAESRREDLIGEVERDLEESRERNRELDEKWVSVAAHAVPEELQSEIAKQHQIITEINQAKDMVIKTLRTEASLKDEQYMEILVRQAADRERIIKLMKEKSAALTAAYQQQALAIEAAFEQERAALLKANAEEMTDLFKKRTDLENTIMPKRQEREDQFYANLAEVRNRDAEDYNLLKEKLEATIQLLEQQLEEMRATYQLNQESLIFSHEVLLERQSENTRALEQQGVKTRRLKEAVSQLVQRFNKQNAAFLLENNTLTTEYNRLVLQFQDFQQKFRHFEQVDKSKYRELWAMNEDEVMELVRKVLAADRVIHEQILYKPWRPPFAPTAAGFDGTVAASATLPMEDFSLTGVDGLAATLPAAVDLSTVTAATLMSDGLVTARPRANSQSVASAAAGSALASGTTVAPTSPSRREETARSEFHAAAAQGKYSPEQVRTVMTALSEHAGFLVDTRTNEVSRDLPAAERVMYRIDAILASLGVEDREDLDELVEAFVGSGGSDSEIHANDVTRIVSKFSQHRKALKSSSTRVGFVKTDPVASEKRARKKEKERQFWHKLGNVLPHETLCVWDTLETQQRNFSKLLQTREKLVEETAAIARQNEELKVLMRQYLQADVNKQLLVPPSMPRF